MKGRRSRILPAALIIAFGLTAAYAFNAYMTTFNSTYPSSPLTGDCGVCHTAGSARNSYGNDYASHGYSYSTIEALDSDGDGFSNLVEINAGTYPGDAMSKPGDTSPPEVTLSMPPNSTALTVSISLSATDNVGVTGYMVNENPVAPSASAQGWLGSAPTSYDFSGAGNKTLYGWAKDAAGNVGGQSASITITAADDVAPTITSFTIPENSASLKVAITSFEATDNIGVTGYAVTESSSAPAAGSAIWSSHPPTSYVFPGAGAKILYAWAKDAAGNIGAASASVTISLADDIPPQVTSFSLPETSSSLTVAITSFEATDNVGVTGYAVTASSSAPAADSSVWASNPPTSHTFATIGDQTLYAWAKDSAGNISKAKSAHTIIDEGGVDLSGMTIWPGAWFRVSIRDTTERSSGNGYINLLSWDEGNRTLSATLYTRGNDSQWQSTELLLHYTSGIPLRFFGWFNYSDDFIFSFSLDGSINKSGELRAARIRAVGLTHDEAANAKKSDRLFILSGVTVTVSSIPSGTNDPEDADTTIPKHRQEE